MMSPRTATDQLGPVKGGSTSVKGDQSVWPAERHGTSASGIAGYGVGSDATPSNDTVASLDGVTLSFAAAGAGASPKVVLSDVSLAVRDGEFLVLVGRSGCGKTTVLNLLSGLLEATQGRVEVLGGSAVSARGRVGYMFARDALLPWRTAVRNVEYVLELKGVPRRERRSQAEEFLALVGLTADIEVFPGRLSQGMRQRVALARTWAFDPALLLMDEPFAALDAQTRLEVQAQFLQIWMRHRKTVVFVTHDLGEAILLADRVLLLADGHVIDEFEVPFCRPRDPVELAGSAEYQEFYNRLRKEI